MSSYSLILPVHIAGGIVGIAAGTAAMVLRKGSHRHALAGKVFVAAMLSMAAAAVYLATLRHQPGNITGGIFTVTLDFGSPAFSGADRFLEINLRPSGNPGGRLRGGRPGEPEGTGVLAADRAA